MMYKKYLFWGIGILFLIGSLFIFSREPSHDRTWELGQEKLPLFEQSGDWLTIKNFRNFEWTGAFEATPHYETRQFNLREIESVDVFISHFSSFEGMAHIFLSFGFKDGEHIVVSVETRREVGEEFSPLLGMLRQFELMYVVGSERDFVGVRTDWREERVYLFPTVASPEQARALLLRFAERANAITEEPRFYHTLTRNCTNLLTREVEAIAQIDFPFTWKTLFPGYLGEVLWEEGLIRRTHPDTFEKEMYRVKNEEISPSSPAYSASLRAQKN